MSTSDTSIVDDFLSWLRSLSNRIESHETRLDEQAKALQEINNNHTLDFDVLSADVLKFTSYGNRITSLESEHARLSAVVSSLQSGGPADPDPVTEPAPIDPDPDSTPVDTDPVIPYSSAVTIDVKNYSHVLAPVGSYVTVAVPVPKSADVLHHDEFSLVDPIGTSYAAMTPPARIKRSDLIPCDVRVTARWGSPTIPILRPIRWVNVTFQITRPISPDTTDQYTLLIGTTEPTQSEQIDVIQLPYKDGYDVLTGATQFRIKATGIEGFLDDGPVSALDSTGTLARLSPTTEDKIKDYGLLAPRRLEVEYWGPLTAIVIEESTLNGQNGQSVIPGPISARRRYQFYANSSTVHVTQSLTWEGSHPDAGGNVKRPDNTWNAILGTLFRESFSLPVSSKAATTVTVLDRASSSTGAAIPFKDSSGKRVTLTQHLRDRRINLSSTGKKELNQTRYSLTVGSSPDTHTTNITGPDADGGLLSVSTPTGSVILALRHMYRYEPQSISYDPATSTLNLDLASDRFRLAHHQSLFVEYSITVSPATQPDLLSVWRDLNTPLIGLVSPECVNASGATWNGIPTYFGQIAADERLKLREGYAKSVRAIIDATLRKRTSEGMQGLLTWGLYPQYWGEWNDFSPDGLGSGLKSWDQTYLEATFTDYWNTTRLAVEGAISLSRPEWVNGITLPAALRMLHTQIVQGPPNLPLDRVGQESIGTSHYGYGLYRTDKNSSHQYFENLWWYYYLTGDYTVVSTIERGARVLLRRFKSGSPVAGREPMQWMSVFLFLDGVSTSTDIDWGKEFDALMTRSIQEHYLYGPTPADTNEAVWIDDRAKLTDTNTTSLYSFGYYDAEMIYQLGLRTGNALIKNAVGGLTVTPYEVIITLARTICTLGFTSVSSTPGDVSANWARVFRATYDRTSSPPRFTSLTSGLKDGDPYLYPDDKPALAAFLARAARLSRDPIIITTARNLLAYTFAAILGKGVAAGVQGARLRDIPMGKLMGLCSGRLGTAVMEMMKLEEELKS